jgi:hypothetical protein
MSLTERIREVKELFPEDKPEVSRYFGAALHAEDTGNDEKAEEYLDKAILYEQK